MWPVRSCAGAIVAIAMVAFAGTSAARPQAKAGTDAAPAAPAEPQAVGANQRWTEQVIPPRPATLQRRLRFQHLGRDSGLPSSEVTSIVQDRTGFIWLGTGDGLARYDGQRFLIFRADSKDPTSLSSSYVTRLLVAKDGTLWVGTEGGGVNRYNPASSTFERFLPSDAPDTLKSASIIALAEGTDGHIWIGTGNGGLSVLDPATKKARTYGPEDGLSTFVPAILPEADGSTWLGTDAGVYLFRPGKGFQLVDKEAINASTITQLRRSRDGGDLWIGTDANGLLRYSPSTGQVKAYRAAPDDPKRLIHDSITALYVDHTGRLWIGTAKGLHTLDPKTERIERHIAETSDPMGLWTSPTVLMEDTAGVLWVGTVGQGAVMLDPRSQHFAYYRIAGVPALALAGGDLWVGNPEGICRWRGDSLLEGSCYSLEFPASAFVDRSGTVWMGIYPDGLARLDPATPDRWRFYKNRRSDPKSIGPGPILRVYQDRAGEIWLGLLGGGLQRYDRARDEFVSYDIGSDQVYSIAQDPTRDHVLWIGTADRGVVRLDVPALKLDNFIPNPKDLDSKTDNAVVDFAFQGNVVWLPTFGGGLKKLDLTTGQFKSYRRSDGMPSDVMYGVLVDHGGKLWLGTPAGLVRFDPASEKIQVFTQVDGLQSDEFTLGTRQVTEDGRFVFGGTAGINIFRPEEIQVDDYRPPLVLTSVLVVGEPYRTGGRPVESLRTFELAFNETIATLEFAALSYSGSKQIQFEYKLEGLNDRWFPAPSAAVNLNGLGDGDYRLVVRARNRHGLESEPIGLGIVVHPPPWRSWWAYSLYAAILLGIGLAVYRYQRTRIRRLQMAARLATVEREFEVTATVQSWFLPEPGLHRIGACDLVGFYRAADTCSGDWWWYEDIGNGKVWIIVADVTGHGAAPAMLTAAVAMGIGVQSDRPIDGVAERLSRVNREVLFRCKGKATMTMTGVVLDVHTGEIVVHSLGGPPALLVDQEGNHLVLSNSGTPLGSVEMLQIGERTATLRQGDRLIITTDGIVETTVKAGRPLGFRRFANVVRDTRTMPLSQAVQAIVEGVDLARAARPQDDDFTFCLIEHR